jgi:hypothetical protein
MTEQTKRHVEQMISRVKPGLTATWRKVHGNFSIRGAVTTSIMEQEAEGFIEGLVAWDAQEAGQPVYCLWHRFTGAKESGFREALRVCNEIASRGNEGDPEGNVNAPIETGFIV